ncbi:hypothetical protein [Thiomicrorhabdus sp. Kp2]|uniref:hypothetical protein n=1 Tax=Thiomicrorhabdus sp. Kp2 TaxID=1123518 RepID=UPI000428F1C6|nr:hypothetical protein [Thiomicrorhabdus sp. Kp2]
MKKVLSLMVLSILISGCSAQLSFIDPNSGERYKGETGSTSGSSGNLTALIENEKFEGEWIYSAMGGSYTLGTVNTSSYGTTGYATGTGTFTGVSPAMSGNGLITMNGDKGSFMRCVFSYSSWSSTGMGQCKRNDGKLFDLTIKK